MKLKHKDMYREYSFMLVWFYAWSTANAFWNDDDSIFI